MTMSLSQWMQNRQGILIAAFAVIVLSGIGFLVFRTVDAPEVRFRTIAGEQFTTSELRGKVVLVNFWATSCAPCMADMPRLAELHDGFSRQGFETVAVAMSYDPPNRVVDYANRERWPFKVVLDIDGAVARTFGDVRLTPTSFLIDRRGRVIREFVGEPDFGLLRAVLEKALSRPT